MRLWLGCIVASAACFLPALSRLCELKDFAHGYWERDNSATRKSFTCCGWDQNDYNTTEIQTDCGTFPRPTKQAYQYGRTDFNVQTGGHGCHCDRVHNTRKFVSPRERWRWRPFGCDVLPWNATQFCELLGDKRIMLVGDSTMVQTAATLMNMVIADTPKGMCGPQLLVVAQDTPHENLDVMTSMFKEFSPDYFVVNFGAHFHSEKSFVDSMTNFTSLLVRLRSESSKPVHIIWKTVNPPHFECEKYHSAVTVAPQKSPMLKDVYQWEMLPRFDKLARNIFSQYGVKVRRYICHDSL